MIAESITVDRFNDVTGSRTIRAELRIGEPWAVTAKTVISELPEYSDEHPDAPDGSFGKWKNGTSGKVIIEVKAKRGRLYKCPECGCMCRAHEYADRTYTHVSDMGHECEIRVNLPKLDCKGCGRKLQIRFPAARAKVSYTKELEKEVMRSLTENTIEGTARKLRIGAWIVSDILKYHVRKAVPEQDLSTVTQIFVDEIQFMNGHNYVTVVSDQMKRIIFMTPGKGENTIAEFVSHLIIQGGDPENIRVVCADMSRAYEAGIEKNLPNATLVFDSFHLVQAINTDLNTVRKRTLRRRKGERLRHVKYTVLKRPENMSEKDIERLDTIRLHNPDLALAFDMKEAFCDILDNTDRYEAEADFEEWYAWVMIEGCREMKERARKFMEKINRIMAWFDHRVSNGYAEAVNALIQKTKAAAFGYANVTNFISMCLYRFGKLTIRF